MAISRLAHARETFPRFAERILAADDANYDEWFRRYCGELADAAGAHRYFTYHTDLLELAGVDPAGAAVLDVGCGFGMTLLLYATLGARNLHGVDIHEGMLATAATYRDLLPEDIRSRFDIRLGDASALPFDDRSMDVVTSIEAISHYLHVEPFIREAARVLRPGGKLIISDGNNGANPVIRRKTQKIWDRFELGPNNSTIEGHRVDVCYSDARERLIRQEFPELDASRARQLALGTFAMTNDQVIEAVRNHLEGGPEPDRRYRPGVVPVGPDGAVMERLFNPRDLARDLSRHGFRARAFGYWGGAAGQPAVRAANRILRAVSPLSMPTARAFRVVATRAA